MDQVQVRFLDVEGVTYALKQLPMEIASREFEVLTHLERLELPAPTSGAPTDPEEERWRLFVADVASPMLNQWRIRRYEVIQSLFRGAKKVYDELRRKSCVLNFSSSFFLAAASSCFICSSLAFLVSS